MNDRLDSSMSHPVLFEMHASPSAGQVNSIKINCNTAKLNHLLFNFQSLLFVRFRGR